MKFGLTEESGGQGFDAAGKKAGQADETLRGAADMRAGSDNAADVFQAELYNSGKRLLEKLETIDGGIGANKSYAELVGQLKQLRDFHFNIGFAGGMSSGKSTVINSLIEYPLMPTCKLTTTCVGTHLFYGEKPRIRVVDDDTGKQVLNVDCTNLPQAHFDKLKEYACVTTHVKIIENLQHFTSCNLFQDKDSLTPDMLQMDRSDANHVVILLMILLTVYVDQNSSEMNRKTLAANQKRKEVLKFFGFDANTVNYTIQLQWNGELLKSGLTITDLPGLGAYAPDKDLGGGKTIKGHDTISTDAVRRTDAMVFLVDPQVDGTGVPALQAMISNAELKGIVNQSDLVIPVLNKVDDCNGASEVKQAVDKFVDILQNTGVKKTAEDVHLYSAWYGEYKFRDIPDDRTCFYFRNYDDLKDDVLEDADAPLAGEQLHRQIMAKSRRKLGVRYKKAGIEELKLFFRSAYVGKSKNRRSQAAVFAVRQLALDTVVPMQEQIKNCDVLRGVAGSAIDDISKGLKASVDGPISQALLKIAQIEHDDEAIRAQLDQIPEKYSEAFSEALEEYKARNLAICESFTCAFGGFSDNARIDQPGSANQMNYAKLREQMEILSIDVKAVNRAFAEVLAHVTQENQSMYESALQVLESLQVDIPKALDNYVESYKTRASDENVLGSVTALRDTLAQYMQQQLDAMLDSMKLNQNNLAKAGNETLEQIFALNARMVGLYTKSVVDEVRANMSNGILFASREYVKIAGESGVKQMLRNLSLSVDDRQYIEDEVRAIGITGISNNLDSWYQDTENTINLYFTSLREQLRRMMDDTVRQLSGDAEQIAQRREQTKRQLKAAKAAFCALRESVQPLYDASVEDAADETLRKYRGDLLSGIAAQWQAEE